MKKTLRQIFSMLLLITCLFSLAGCGGIKKEEEDAVIQSIKLAYQGQDLEGLIQKDVRANPSFPDISGGEFKWKVFPVSDGVYDASYGYWGQHPWWKIGLGFGVELLTTLLTLGYASFNPWPWDPDGMGLFITYEVNFNTDRLRILDKKPDALPFTIDFDFD